MVDGLGPSGSAIPLLLRVFGHLVWEWVVRKSPELAVTGVPNSELGTLLSGEPGYSRFRPLSGKPGYSRFRPCPKTRKAFLSQGSGYMSLREWGTRGGRYTSYRATYSSCITLGLGKDCPFRADLVVNGDQCSSSAEGNLLGERGTYCVCVHEVRGMMVHTYPGSNGGRGEGTRPLGGHVLGTQGRS